MGIVRSQKTVRLFAREHGFCWYCGRRDSLHSHHIIGGAGRSDIRENLSRLCLFCHERAEGTTVCITTHDGRTLRLKPIPLENVLYLKKRYDPEHYDRKRLAELAHKQTLPRAVRPKGWAE